MRNRTAANCFGDSLVAMTFVHNEGRQAQRVHSALPTELHVLADMGGLEPPTTRLQIEVTLHYGTFI